MGVQKNLLLNNDLVTREEVKIGECPYCKADITEIYEKDETPGFRSKDTWTNYSCECRFFMDKSKEEIWEDVHNHYEQNIIPQYKDEIKQLKKILEIYKQEKFICSECKEVFDNEEKEYCERCCKEMCQNCYKDNNLCYDCSMYDPLD